MDDASKEDAERALREHFDDMLREMHRRDVWLINSIWNVVRTVTLLGYNLTAVILCLMLGLTEWWQICLALTISFALSTRTNKKSRELEEDDKRKIGADSVLGVFRFWF